MSLEYANQRYLPSLIHNGSFSRGAAHWVGSFLRHVRVGGSEGSGTANAPQYALRIARSEDSEYVDVVPPGAVQFIDRPDLASYPSVRQASGLLLTPLSRTRAFVQVVLGSSALDGVTLTDAPAQGSSSLEYENIFQNPFLHRDVDGTVVTIPSGSEIPLVDNRRPESSGVYRASRTLVNASGDSSNSTPPLNEFTYHGLEISTSSPNEFWALASSDTATFTNASVTYVDSSTATVELFLDPDVLMKVDREQEGVTPSRGVAVGDIFTSYGSNEFTSTISDISYGSTSVTLTLTTVSNYQKSTQPFVQASGAVESWDIFIPSSCTIIRAMPLFGYDFTLALTYSISSDSVVPDPSLIEFRSVGASDISGLGAVTATIPRISGSVETLPLNNVGSVDLDWERRLARFFRESSEPLDGRCSLRILPPNGGTSDGTNFSVNSIQKFDAGFVVNTNDGPVTFDDGAISISVSTPSGLPPDWVSGKLFEFTIDSLSTNSQILVSGAGPWAWLQKLADAGIITEVLDDDNNSSATTALVFINWDPDLFGDVTAGDYQITPDVGDAFSVQGLSVGFGLSTVSDVYLAKGNYTDRFEFQDDPTYVSTDPISNKVAIDDLRNGMDQLENMVPKGTVILYSGGGTCPPGYKRVDAFPDAISAGAGTESLLPLPDTVTYDSSTDRTSLIWEDREFPLTDVDGQVIALPDLSEPVSLEIPTDTGVFESVVFNVNQQIFQPGMTLRVPAFEPPNLDGPLYLGSDPGNSLSLIFDQDEFSAGAVSASSYEAIQGELVELEIWFKLDVALTTQTVLVSKWQKIIGEIVGWAIYLNPDGTITIEQRVLSVGGTSSGINTYTTSNDFLGVSTGVTGFWRMFVQFSSRSSDEPTLGSDGTIDISSTATGYQTFVESWAWQNVVTGAMDNTGPLMLGARSSLGQSSVSGGGVTIDMFRMFSSGSVSIDGLALWNNGLGLSQVPLGLESRLACEFRFDEGVGGGVGNTSGAFGASDGVILNQVSWEEGLIPITASGLYNSLDYRSALEDRDRSFLITDLLYNIQEKSGTFTSGVPYDATNANNQGSASGSVTYPSVILGSDLAEFDLPIPPVGPGNSEQNEVFGDFPTTSGLALFDARSTIVRAGITVGITAWRSSDAGQTTLFNGIVGDVYWLSWTDGANSGSYAARLTRIKFTSQFSEYDFERYDGQKALGFPDSTPFGVVITIRPAILYGVGTQTLKEDGTIEIPGVTQNRTDTATEIYWTTRLSIPDIQVNVQGNLVIPDRVSNILVEPTGYLRYDEPDFDRVDYGSGGHSHSLDGNLVQAVDDLIPRVNEKNTTFADTVPFVNVASDHGHGLLPTYRFPLPKFRLLSVCEKL